MKVTRGRYNVITKFCSRGASSLEISEYHKSLPEILPRALFYIIPALAVALLVNITKFLEVTILQEK